MIDIASGIISFRNNKSYGPRFMSKMHFLVNILRMTRRISIKFYICIAQTLVSERSGMELQVG